MYNGKLNFFKDRYINNYTDEYLKIRSKVLSDYNQLLENENFSTNPNYFKMFLYLCFSIQCALKNKGYVEVIPKTLTDKLGKHLIDYKSFYNNILIFNNKVSPSITFETLEPLPNYDIITLNIPEYGTNQF